MSDLENRLVAALRADVPPARDAVFRVEVLVRLERARFRRQVRRTLAVALFVALLAVLNLPAIDEWLTADGQRLWFVALAAAAAALCVSFLLMMRPGGSNVARAVGRLLYP